MSAKQKDRIPKQASRDLLEAVLVARHGGEPRATARAPKRLPPLVALLPVLAWTLVGCRWREDAPMPTARHSLGAATVSGLVYAVGGSRSPYYDERVTEEYNPALGTWRTKAPMPSAREDFATVAVGGKIYLLGGTDLSAPFPLPWVDAYDPVADQWTTRASLPTGRYGGGAAAFGGRIFAVGGICKGGPVWSWSPCTLDEYDPASDSWTVGGLLPDRLQTSNVNAAALGGKIYALSCNAACTLDELDPVTKTWTPRAPLPRPRYDSAFVAWRGKLYVIGGMESRSGPFERGPSVATMDEYDPALDTWTPREPMPTARSSLAAAATDEAIFAIGGTMYSEDVVSEWIPLKTVEEYSDLTAFATPRKPLK